MSFITTLPVSGNDGICGKYAKKEYYSTTRNTLTLQFTTGIYVGHKYENFEAILTPFHYGKIYDNRNSNMTLSFPH